MGQALSILQHTKTFYSGFWYYLVGKGRTGPYLIDDGKEGDSAAVRLFRQHTRIHLFSLASNFYLFRKPHYRKGSYRDDLIDNLRNVAIPGTGIPLSLAVRNRLFALTFLMTTYPCVSFIAALHKWARSWFKESIADEYATRLLAPDDWFNYWRLNCNVVGLHALLNDMPKGYQMENKWAFLEHGDKVGVPVSPFFKTENIVVKHRNEEGGMGIFFYKNAANGGDWIIQKTIQNSDWVSSMLPSDAPLSTFRVLTQSRASIDLSKPATLDDITALSCVFRAGRKGAATDHDSILFDVDVKTGLIRRGTTNVNWYRLGLHEALPGRCPWRSHHSIEIHPDTDDVMVKGNVVPDMKGMLKLVEESHLKMCPDVPFAGWDVVLSTDPNLPVCLLEVNLSCNFFRGSFDKKVYLDFIDESFSKIQAQRLVADAEGKKF